MQTSFTNQRKLDLKWREKNYDPGKTVLTLMFFKNVSCIAFADYLTREFSLPHTYCSAAICLIFHCLRALLFFFNRSLFFLFYRFLLFSVSGLQNCFAVVCYSFYSFLSSFTTISRRHFYVLLVSFHKALVLNRSAKIRTVILPAVKYLYTAAVMDHVSSI